MRRFFVQRPWLALARQNEVSVLKYSTGDKVGEMAEKATSTAEEFIRQAKEKKDKMSDTVKENLDEAKEAVMGETEEQKEKYKEKVEKGNYDNIGRP